MSVLDSLECLGCLKIESDPVTLMNGRTVCNVCPAYRFECEARELASNKYTREQRIAHLRGIRERRGDEEANRLKQALIEIHAKRAA